MEKDSDLLVYNEYLKGISSSESNKSKNETNYVSKKNHKIRCFFAK